MLDSQTTRVLDQVCQKIERQYPGSVAAYEGFAQARICGDDSVPTIEVFDLPEGETRSFAAFTEKLLLEIGYPQDVDFYVLGWTKEQTKRSFARDVEAVRAARLNKSMMNARGQSSTHWIYIESSDGIQSWLQPSGPIKMQPQVSPFWDFSPSNSDSGLSSAA